MPPCEAIGNPRLLGSMATTFDQQLRAQVFNVFATFARYNVSIYLRCNRRLLNFKICIGKHLETLQIAICYRLFLRELQRVFVGQTRCLVMLLSAAPASQRCLADLAWIMGPCVSLGFGKPCVEHKALASQCRLAGPARTGHPDYCRVWRA